MLGDADKLLAPGADLTGVSQPSGRLLPGFRSSRSPSSALDISTTVMGPKLPLLEEHPGFIAQRARDGEEVGCATKSEKCRVPNKLGSGRLRAMTNGCSG